MTLASFLLQLLNGLSSASALFLVAAGLTLIFGVTRIVNFAHGSFYMLGAYFAYTISAKFFGNSFPGFIGSVVLASIIVGAIGIFVELVLLRRIYHAPELFQLIATFCVVLVVKDVTRMGWGSEASAGDTEKRRNELQSSQLPERQGSRGPRVKGSSKTN